MLLGRPIGQAAKSVKRAGQSLIDKASKISFRPEDYTADKIEFVAKEAYKMAEASGEQIGKNVAREVSEGLKEKLIEQKCRKI